MTYAIETFDLTKAYGTKTAVAGLNVRVEEQEIFGMLGPNGAGKTTTVKMLTTLLRPTSGRARVAGFEVTKEQAKIRKNIGYLPQQLTSDDTLTGYENILFYSKLYGLPKESRQKQIVETLQLVELTESANEMVSTYSGGMKRRLELASVLITKPRILFLDEPTLGLDPTSRAFIWGFIRRLSKEFRSTVFLTTNYMDEADKLCDNVTIIDSGKAIVAGPPSKLKATVGGDIITLTTAEKGEMTFAEVLKAYSYVRQIERVNNKVKLIVEGRSGEDVIPLLLGDLEAKGLEVSSVTLQKPSLDDVFTSYTGRTLLRDAAAEAPRKIKHRARMLRAMRL